MKFLLYLIAISLFLSVFISCKEKPIPKPRGYFRISFPEKKYQVYNSGCPFSFEVPAYSLVVPDIDAKAEPCWLNIDFPAYEGKIHISYKPIDHNANKFFEDARTLAYKHTVKADAIEETEFTPDTINKIFGMLYEIKGNAASSVQFFVTDSLHHFLRGALYFNSKPNSDSLAPVIDFLKKDILHLVETIRWNDKILIQ